MPNRKKQYAVLVPEPGSGSAAVKYFEAKDDEAALKFPEKDVACRHVLKQSLAVVVVRVIGTIQPEEEHP